MTGQNTLRSRRALLGVSAATVAAGVFDAPSAVAAQPSAPVAPTDDQTTIYVRQIPDTGDPATQTVAAWRAAIADAVERGGHCVIQATRAEYVVNDRIDVSGLESVTIRGLGSH